ncbi:LegC family aminotransferase [Cohnella cholangitidis]|uniref:LegC family aminotransferase n=1 Tax=Cohnella cholangitidis TaxID=2598458 RepID=A0A7G5BXM0_9BACL|nr:LegC family aminotransferase [Cohnella cholangitidis]QMV41704.1 LegC family aminotransferase [Cohnella cholangitidis]
MSEHLNVSRLIEAIRWAIDSEKSFVGLHEPVFQGREKEYVLDCIETGWVSSVGQYVDRFEQMLAEYTGSARAVAVVNGTAALHISLLMSGVTQNDEVLCPTLSFVATANAIAYCGAIPHFVDIDERTLGIDPEKLDTYLGEITRVDGERCYNKFTGRAIKAVIAMHTFGHPVNLDRLIEVCTKYSLELVEDAAESLGSFYKGKHTGTFSKLSAVSFNGNKIMTTGGGGAILAQDEELGKLVKHITTTAKVPHRWDFNHDHIGYNYRLPNLNAALGCAQLEQLPIFLSRKRKLANRYREQLRDLNGVRFFEEPLDSNSNYWLNTILLEDKGQRDSVLQQLNDNGLMSRPAWTLLHQLQIYSTCPRMDLVNAENLSLRMINIPSSSFLGGIYE